MACYRDSADWGVEGQPRGHLIADSLDELHAVAEAIGLTRRQFMGHCVTPHYQLPQSMHEVADAAGVVYLKRSEFMRKVGQVCSRLREPLEGRASGNGQREAQGPKQMKVALGETASLFDR